MLINTSTPSGKLFSTAAAAACDSLDCLKATLRALCQQEQLFCLTYQPHTAMHAWQPEKAFDDTRPLRMHCL
jgi:hypothetical protein